MTGAKIARSTISAMKASPKRASLRRARRASTPGSAVAPGTAADRLEAMCSSYRPSLVQDRKCDVVDGPPLLHRLPAKAGIGGSGRNAVAHHQHGGRLRKVLAVGKPP